MRNHLYIIGNGFDLAHGVKSAYNHFYQWLIANLRFDVLIELEKIFPNKTDGGYLLWSSFEDALGEYDVNKARHWGMEDLYFVEVTEFGEDNERTILSPIDTVDVDISSIVTGPFTEWIQSIGTPTTKVFELDKDALFLSFNYTKTFEELYGIEPKDILHIHGQINGDGPLIVGHRTKISQNDFFDESSDLHSIFEQDRNYMDMTMLYKPIEDIIQKNERFFDSLRSADNITVIGHSCNSIDYLYFDKIRSSVSDNCLWKFSYHSDQDKEKIQQLTSRLRIYEYETFLL